MHPHWVYPLLMKRCCDRCTKRTSEFGELALVLGAMVSKKRSDKLSVYAFCYTKAWASSVATGLRIVAQRGK